MSNNSVSEEVKLRERTSRVGKSKFDSSVNYRDLWDDDLTNWASPLLHQDSPPRRAGLSGPLRDLGVVGESSLLGFTF